MSAIDPFSAFDEEDTTEAGIRPPENGVLVFHRGTEQALLHFVYNGTTNVESNASAKRRQIVQLVDDFCFSRHWMMHIGPEKGEILVGFLVKCLEHYLSLPTDNIQPFLVVEVGTYCGYSLIIMADTILKYLNKGSRYPPFHILTVDVNPENITVAQQLASMAGLTDHVSFLCLEHPEEEITPEISEKLRESLKEKNLPDTSAANFVFFDHNKTAYLSDLRQLERSGFIKAGSFVAADNILFFGLDEYRQHMAQLSDQQVVKTRLVKGSLEYVTEQTRQREGNEELVDGMGTCGREQALQSRDTLIFLFAHQFFLNILSPSFRTDGLPKRPIEIEKSANNPHNVGSNLHPNNTENAAQSDTQLDLPCSRTIAVMVSKSVTNQSASRTTASRRTTPPNPINALAGGLAWASVAPSPTMTIVL